MEVFEPALIKLTNLLNMIEFNASELLYQTSSEDQSRLLGHNIEQFKNKDEMGIRNENICLSINFICDLQNTI